MNSTEYALDSLHFYFVVKQARPDGFEIWPYRIVADCNSMSFTVGQKELMGRFFMPALHLLLTFFAV